MHSNMPVYGVGWLENLARIQLLVTAPATLFSRTGKIKTLAVVVVASDDSESHAARQTCGI